MNRVTWVQQCEQEQGLSPGQAPPGPRPRCPVHTSGMQKTLSFQMSSAL